MSDYVWLDCPLHKNNFPKIDFEKEESLLSSIQLSFDGSIMAVKRAVVEPYYEEQEVHMVRLGYKKPPKDIKVEDLDGLYKALAYYVKLE